MESYLFLRGIFIGLALGIPLGPVGVMCIRRSLSDGSTVGFFVGLGAALGDTALGSAAGLGLSFVANFLEAEQGLFRVIGGVVLLVVAGVGYKRTPSLDSPVNTSHGSLARDVAGTFLITISNPATILSAMGVAAAAGVTGHYVSSEIGFLVCGIFTGSVAWFLAIAVTAGFVRHRISTMWLTMVSHCLAVVLAIFGVVILGSGIIDLAAKHSAYFR